MLEEGTKAPAFSLASADGNTVSLSELRGSWVVLYFYPKDNTPGCTIEARDFTRLAGAFSKLGARVFGVSRDSVDSHCRFIEKQDLTVELLSDPDHTVIEAYGAWREKKLYGKLSMGIVRSTCVIDPSGAIAASWDAVKANGHAQTVLDRLTDLVGTRKEG